MRKQHEVPQKIANMVELLGSSCKKDKMRALWTLGETRDPAAVPYVKKMLKNPEYVLKLSAVEALGKIGHESVVSPLAKALDDVQVSDRAVMQLIVVGNALKGRNVEDRHAKALLVIHPHIAENEGRKIVAKALNAALKKKINETSAAEYVAELRRKLGAVRAGSPVP